MPFETAFKVTCYPMNPAYKPRVEILRDADPKLARKKYRLQTSHTSRP